MSQRTEKPGRIAIIGGGAAGALTAIHLLENPGTIGEIVLIDKGGDFGKGVAYGACASCHLLNVRAINLSAYSRKPRHFVDWLLRNEHGDDVTAPNTYFPRTLYGSYLSETLSTAEERSSANLVRKVDSVRALVRSGSGFEVRSEQETLLADQVVLALGELAPRAPAPLCELRGCPRFAENPWKADLSKIDIHDSVLILGTGLTMVDMALFLHQRGHQGKITAVSRRGLLPQRHRINMPATYEIDFLLQPDAVRRITRLLRESGEDWRSVIDGIRPHVPAIWKSLPWAERKRFLGRLQPYWNSVRHRMAASVHDRVNALKESNQLEVAKGSISRVELCGDSFLVSMEGHPTAMAVDWIFNCTGPQTNWKAAKSPLLESLTRAGLATYDPMGLGLLVDDDGRTAPQSNIWALGAICRGCRWETTAIPEIRAQAKRIAELLSGQPTHL